MFELLSGLFHYVVFLSLLCVTLGLRIDLAIFHSDILSAKQFVESCRCRLWRLALCHRLRHHVPVYPLHVIYLYHLRKLYSDKRRQQSYRSHSLPPPFAVSLAVRICEIKIHRLRRKVIKLSSRRYIFGMGPEYEAAQIYRIDSCAGWDLDVEGEKSIDKFN